MRRIFLLLVFLVAGIAVRPAWADTRVTLSQDAVALGGSVQLVIETDQPIASPDLSPLQADFEVGSVGNARQFNISGGSLAATQTIEVSLRPRRSGLLPIPSLAIGNQRTSPLMVEVFDPQSGAASAPARASTAATQANGAVFIDTEFDDDTPYVQQAVGVTVRLHYAIDLYNGEFRQPEPEQGGSLQPVGSDSRSVRVVNGRQYHVLERHYLLVPERSGALRLPGASFRGEGAAGFFDGLFGDGRESVSAEAPARTLQVRAMPARGGQPWLPARNVTMRMPPPSTRAVAGESFDVVVELRADGVTATQLPEITLQAGDAQVFAEPAQPTENFVDGRPQVMVARRFSVVPQHPGTLELRVAPIAWWDVVADQPRRAQLPAASVQVMPGLGRYSQAPADPASRASDPAQAPERGAAISTWLQKLMPAASILLGLGVWAWVMSRRRHDSSEADALASGTGTASISQYGADTASTSPTASRDVASNDAASNELREFRRAVDVGDLAGVARLLPRLSKPPSASLPDAITQLDDPAQREAAARLEGVLWGGADADALAADIRNAFARGPRWRKPERPRKPLLPPLYPEP